MSIAIVFVAEIGLFGLILSSSVRWVYYIYEGHVWSWLTFLPAQRTRRSLLAAEQAQEQLYGERTLNDLTAGERRKARALNDYLSDFLPEQAIGPTRLANIIITCERYPQARYAVNGNEFWHHILTFAPDNVRKELDDQASLAQSVVLGSAAATIVVLVGAAVLVGLFIGKWRTFAQAPFGSQGAMLYMVIGITGWWLFYRLALTAHREVRRVFRAAVDLAMPKFVEWMRAVQAPLSELDAIRADNIWYYLSFGELRHETER